MAYAGSKHPGAPPDPADEYAPAFTTYQYAPAFTTYQYPPPNPSVQSFPPGYDVKVEHTHHVGAPGDAYSYTKTTTTEAHPRDKPKDKLSSPGGLLGSLTKAGEKLVNKGLVAANKTVDYVSAKLDETISKHYGNSAIMNLFQTGNVVQLISKTTGRTLQILQAPNGQLVLDGNGPDDPQAFHTHFIVTREPDNVVTLHNNYNYVAVVNGFATVHRAAEQGHVTLHCRLRLHEPSDKYVSMESLQEKTSAVGVTSSGAMKSALATRYTDKDAFFAVRLIYSPHGAPPTINSKDKSTK